ncbi:uncharacterized protein BDV14DRAFT_210983 [Aspergillus stella-maris]|uniref:uncharacterized protein n=1 Tax=Aspergillus stella-maris TaxID=1810926 RepID=UPI003CCDE487
MDHSLLAYARFHGIASEYTAVDPFSQIDDTFELCSEDISLLQNTISDFKLRLYNAQSTLDKRLRTEKLGVSKDAARFLTSVIREIQTDTIVIDWDDVLPEFRRCQDAQVEPVVFSQERESDVRLSKKSLRYSIRDMDLGGFHEPIEIFDEPSPLDHIRRNGVSLLEQVKRDRLKASKGAFSIIQCVQKDDKPSTEELEAILGCLLDERSSNPVNTESPILIPLNTEYFPPSPTPALDEYMLPSPVSSAGVDVDLYCRRRTPPRFRSGGAILDTQNERPMSLGLDREIPQKNRTYVDYGTPSMNPIELDTAADPKTMNICNELETSRVGTISADICDEVDQSPTCSLLCSGTTNNATQPAKRLRARTPEGTMPATEQKTSKKRRTNNLKTSSKGMEPLEVPRTSHMPSSQELPRHPVTTASKQLPPLQRIPDRKSQSERPERQGVAKHKPTASQEHHSLQARPKLGSLSSFLETRGRAPRRQMPEKSPYFGSTDARNSEQPEIITKSQSQVYQPKSNISTTRLAPTPSLPVIQAPRVGTNHEGLVLFTSTALLKMHPKVIQCLEGSGHPPKLIYRDYTESPSKRQSRLSPQHQRLYKQKPLNPLPKEADIILSPSTGLILATSQATMQLFLPGHKPTVALASSSSSSSPGTLVPNIKSITSPFRETIFTLSTRYEQLYILITQNADQNNAKGPRSRTQDANPTLSADKPLLTSLTSLSAFCTSLSISTSNARGGQGQGYASVTPLLIPSSPESITSWILALAHKHLCAIPAPRNLPQNNAFTPINPKPQLVGLLGNAQESVWEGFLRRAGLNPFAARVVIAILERDGCQSGISSISRFVEMSVPQRRMLFGGLLGDKTLKRVESLIERDWQCDWALRFDDEIE